MANVTQEVSKCIETKQMVCLRASLCEEPRSGHSMARLSAICPKVKGMLAAVRRDFE